ncbi:MAG TPA: hypothetical protein VNF47_00600 [Streptosporangiaceae bacterium]|nr:hypothetical protein [Streptosporangiaceae bacterium]
MYLEGKASVQPKHGAHRLDRDAASRLTPVNSSRRGAGQAKGGRFLAAAACLLLLLAAAQGYVSFRAQYTFIDHAKRSHIPSMLEALGLDTGAVIFALLALSLARYGQAAAVERVLNVACAVGSMTMNLLAADLTSPRSIAVWVMPSVLYAFASDRLIAVVRRWVRANDPESRATAQGSPWRSLGTSALWLVRLVFDPAGTVAGLRRWVLVVAPLDPGPHAISLTAGQPGAIGAADGGNAGKPIPGETKREALFRLYEELGHAGDPRYGNPAKAAQLAGELAAQIGYHPGTARRELARYLAGKLGADGQAQQHPGTAVHPVINTNDEAVA